MKTCYKLTINNQKDFIAYGIDSSSLSDDMRIIANKVNATFKKYAPWKECCLYYQRGHMCFISLDSLAYFLIYLCKLTENELNILSDNSHINILTLDCCSNGLSQLYGVYFDDEVLNNEETKLCELNLKYNDDFYISEKPSDDIKLTKETYKNIKRFY